jgi:hypothetical protein
MRGEYVVYLGRTVPKEGFRVFVYGYDGAQKLSTSWDEYQEDIGAGVWFSTKELVPNSKRIAPDLQPKFHQNIPDKKPIIKGRK